MKELKDVAMISLLLHQSHASRLTSSRYVPSQTLRLAMTLLLSPCTALNYKFLLYNVHIAPEQESNVEFESIEKIVVSVLPGAQRIHVK